MNSSLINDYFYSNIFGTTFAIEIIYFAILLPLCIVGFFLNTLSVYVIHKVKQKNVNIIYKYLMVYCLNSTFVMILGLPSFYYFTPQIIGFKTDLFAKIINYYLSNYFGPSFYLFGNLMDILICYDRLTIFKIKLKSSEKYMNPYLIIIGLYIICFGINVLSLLRVRIASDEEVAINLMRSINTTTIFYLNGRGIFSTNVFAFASYLFCRDILTLILEISISIVLVINVREYIKNSSVNETVLNHAQTRHHQNNQNQTNARKLKRQVIINLSKLTLYLSLISIISHLLVFMTFIGFFLVSKPIIINSLITFSFFSLYMKHAINFFVLILLDKNFNRIFKAIFSKPTTRN